jgi:hypothetical protein
MIKEDVKSILQNFQQELFAFGFALIPDELQVQQMVMDVINLLYVEGSFKADLIKAMKGEGWNPEEKFRLRLHLLKSLHSMSKRRYSQIKESLHSEGKEGYSSFYALNFDERALLWLQSKTNLDQDDIALIFRYDKSKLLATLTSTRDKINNYHTGVI